LSVVLLAMQSCDLQTELTSGDQYLHRCQREGCGRTFVSSAPRHQVMCRVQPEGSAADVASSVSPPMSSPSLFQKAASFVSAETRWIAAGRPVRSEERVAEIFSICQACERFRPGASELEGSCAVCGCRLRSTGGLFNKIQMATESCPLKPPKWTADAPAVVTA
jgi:hypothetical protein